MYATLSDLIFDLTGQYVPLPVQTFGFFVALSFLIGGHLLSKELERKESQGLMNAVIKKVFVGSKATIIELITAGLIGAVIGFKLLLAFLDYGSFVDNPQAFILSTKGSLLGAIIGAAVSAYLKYKEKNDALLEEPEWQDVTIRPVELTGNIIMLAAVFGLLGAKIFHLMENPNEIAGMLDSVESFFSGLTMYGGLIVASVAVIVYARKNGIKPIHIMDAAGPTLMIGYGIGRIGCQLSGDGDWGVDNLAAMPDWLSFLPDWMWSFTYPHNVISEGLPIPGCQGAHCYELANPVWPTPFYETIISISLFFGLWYLRKRITIPGVLFCVYLIMNGTERFFIEKIRINEVITFGNIDITQAEIISTCLVIIGGAGAWWLTKQHAKNESSLDN